MGVFKWLRRDRISPAETVATTPNSGPSSDSDINTDTIRTPEYQRDLAQFFQRRSISTPPQTHRPKESRHKTKDGRHSLPPTCLCPVKSPEFSFRYERKAEKCKDKAKRKINPKKLTTTDSGSQHEGVPKIQFLYSNQIFMPGTIFGDNQEQKSRKNHRNERLSLQSCQATVHKHQDEEPMDLMHQVIEFPEEENSDRQPPPLFFKNNSLPYEIEGFLASPGIDSEGDVDLELERCQNKRHTVRPLQSSPRSRRKSSLRREMQNDLQQRSKVKMQELKSLDSNADDVGEDKRNVTQGNCLGVPVVPHNLLTIKEVSNCENDDWALGYWGSMPIHVRRKKNSGTDNTKMESSAEMNVLTMYRHPNLLLLMGISYDIDRRLILIFEHYESTLFDSLHIQGKILSAQTATKMISDVANALTFLYMQGYIHSNLSSKCIMLTYPYVPKLTDFEYCFHFPRRDNLESRNISNSLKNSMYLPGPQYTSINDGNPQFDLPQDWEPLISSTSGSETNCLMSTRNGRKYELYKQSGHFRWHAPEIFQPEDYDLIYPCSRSDVYSLSLIMWEICNAAIPWKSLNYDQLSDLYVNWKTGIQLPKDGSYPGCLLDILESGLKLQRDKRPDIKAFSKRMQEVQVTLDQMDPLYINKRVCQKMSEFSVASSWNLDAANSGTSLILNLVKTDDKAYVQEKILSSGSSSKTHSDFEDAITEGTTTNGNNDGNTFNVKDEELDNYNHYFEDGNLDKISEEFQAFSTPGKAPFGGGQHNVQALCLNLHRSDSTEYCSLFSPEIRESLDCSTGWKHNDALANRSLKLNQSVTPRSYRPLEIKMPTPKELENIKSLTQSFETHPNKGPNYSFDIKNYSLPTTPIARNNKIRRNAWLAGQCETIEEVDLVNNLKACEKEKEIVADADNQENSPEVYLSPTTSRTLPESADDKEQYQLKLKHMVTSSANTSADSSDRDVFTGLKRIRKTSCSSLYSAEPSNLDRFRSRSQSWSCRLQDEPNKCVMDEELAHVAVKPLVEFHERWINEANKKCGRSNSLPENYRGLPQAVKPASHCVDSLSNMRPFQDKLVAVRPGTEPLPSVATGHDARHSQSPKLGTGNLVPSKSCHIFETSLWKKENINSMAGTRTSCSTPVKALKTSISTQSEVMNVDRSMNTSNLEEFVQDIIRREFEKLVIQLGDTDVNERSSRNEKFVQQVTAKVIAELNNKRHVECKTDDFTHAPESQKNKTKECPNHSKTKCLKELPNLNVSDGNSSPLIQIMFNKAGNAHCSETSLNLTVSDCVCGEKGGADNANRQAESTEDEMKQNCLKRCQAFSAIQEARSTEDLYIDDELSAHMDMEGLQGLKFIPLHSTLHEVLCDKDEYCCLLKMQEETGCDRMYLICDYPSEQEDQQTSEELKQESSTALKTIEEEPGAESLNNESKSCCRLVTTSGGRFRRKEECDNSKADSKKLISEDNALGAEADIMISIDALVPCSGSSENSFQGSLKSSEINEAFDKDIGTEKEINLLNNVQSLVLMQEDSTDGGNSGKACRLLNDVADKLKA